MVQNVTKMNDKDDFLISFFNKKDIYTRLYWTLNDLYKVYNKINAFNCKDLSLDNNTINYYQQFCSDFEFRWLFVEESMDLELFCNEIFLDFYIDIIFNTVCLLLLFLD